MKKLFITSFALAAAIISSFSFSSQKSDEPKAKINWVTIEQAEKLNKQKPKKIMIDLYTSWCGYCKQLDAVTFEDPKVIAYVNENFYPVKFNAERTDTIIFNKDTLVNLGVPFNKRAPHQFTVKYGAIDGRLGYPTIAYLDGTNSKIQAIAGYFNAEEFMIPLHFINDNVYKTKTWETYYSEEIAKLPNNK
jgi:thioredoxin-related protein